MCILCIPCILCIIHIYIYTWSFKSTLISARANFCSRNPNLLVLPISARGTARFENNHFSNVRSFAGNGARLREIALVVRPVFLNQPQAVKTQEVLVWQISARDGKMRSTCQKHIRTSKQPEINARRSRTVKSGRRLSVEPSRRTSCHLLSPAVTYCTFTVLTLRNLFSAVVTYFRLF